MALFMVKTWMGNKNPDDYFDPVTHIATEENFIKFLECGVYDSKYIGYKVQLGNSVGYNNGLWVIADVNHDSANTGQTNCYDLISLDCFDPGNNVYSSSSYLWRSSTVRTWLNNTFYTGFGADFKPHLLSIKYNSENTWYVDDKVILPSALELGGPNNAVITSDVSVKYPIFTQNDFYSDNASRVKTKQGTATNSGYWSRTHFNTSGSTSVASVNASGALGNYLHYYEKNNVAPIIRVQ